MPVNDVSFGAFDILSTRHFTWRLLVDPSLNKFLLGSVIQIKDRLRKVVIQYVEITLRYIKNPRKQAHCVKRGFMCSCLIVGNSRTGSRLIYSSKYT